MKNFEELRMIQEITDLIDKVHPVTKEKVAEFREEATKNIVSATLETAGYGIERGIGPVFSASGCTLVAIKFLSELSDEKTVRATLKRALKELYSDKGGPENCQLAAVYTADENNGNCLNLEARLMQFKEDGIPVLVFTGDGVTLDPRYIEEVLVERLGIFPVKDGKEFSEIEDDLSTWLKERREVLPKTVVEAVFN